MNKLTTTEELQKMANQVRQDVIKMLLAAGSGHPAGSLSSTEIYTALYFFIMRHDPKNPNWGERDRLIVSHGHTCPAQYAAMAAAGYFPRAKLKTYAALDSPLQGHPERVRLPGIETTSGPLGCGLAQAAGYALAARMDGARFRVYCIASDGEHNEGNHWEAVLFAGKYKLANLTLFVDRNKIQIDGTTEQVLPLTSLADKYKTFGWNTIEIDGHNFEQIIDAVDKARKFHQGPTVIIANTVAGKGVSFMEGKPEWHAKAPNSKEAKEALKELKNA